MVSQRISFVSLAGVLVAITVNCGGDRLVGENRTLAPEPPDSSTSASDLDATVPEAAPGDAGAPQHRFSAADPCGPTGVVAIAGTTPFSLSTETTASARGYIVRFDPPAVLADVSLMEETPAVFPFRYAATVNPAELPDAPDCEALRSDAVFTIFRSGTGNFMADQPYINPSSGSAGCGGSIDYQVEAPADRVRVFGMLPGAKMLEGPLALTHDANDHWIGQMSDVALPGCLTPGYVIILVAHYGRYVVGITIGAI
jgi:hypothetical protein